MWSFSKTSSVLVGIGVLLSYILLYTHGETVWWMPIIIMFFFLWYVLSDAMEISSNRRFISGFALTGLIDLGHQVSNYSKELLTAMADIAPLFTWTLTTNIDPSIEAMKHKDIDYLVEKRDATLNENLGLDDLRRSIESFVEDTKVPAPASLVRDLNRVIDVYYLSAARKLTMMDSMIEGKIEHDKYIRDLVIEKMSKGKYESSREVQNDQHRR